MHGIPFNLRTLYIGLIFMIINHLLIAQTKQIRFEALTPREGLSNGTVNAILKDHKGFMWFGTEDGLNRYDGYQFKIYRYNEHDSTSIIGNDIEVIFEDNNQNLWVGTTSGLCKYIPEKDIFYRFPKNTKGNNRNGLGANYISSIIQSKDGKIWVSTLGGGISWYDSLTNAFHNLNFEHSISELSGQNHIWQILEDHSGNFWVATIGSGLYYLNYTTKEFLHYHYYAKDSLRFPAFHVREIEEDRLGNIWFGTERSGLFKFNPQEKVFTQFETGDEGGPNKNSIWSILEDRFGNFWLGTDGGGINFKANNSSIYHFYYHNPTNYTSIKSNVIRTIYEDNNGEIWIGTYPAGIAHVSVNYKDFNHYIQQADPSKSISHNTVKSICETRDGQIFIGTDGGGLNIFNREHDTFKHYKYSAEKNSPNSNAILSIIQSKSGLIWIGNYNGGINHFDLKTELFSSLRYQPDNPKLRNYDHIWKILETTDGQIYLGTTAGFGRYNQELHQFEWYQDSSNINPTGNQIRALYEDKRGNIWIGSFGGGLQLFDPQTATFTTYLNEEGNPKSLSQNNVSALYEDSNLNFWVGTYGGGLNLFDRDAKTFQTFKVDDGLPNNVICDVLEDSKQNLWISTNSGISKFNYSLKKFRNFDVEDGLQDNEFMLGSSFKLKSGEMIFGGINGFNIFHPDSIRDNPTVPEIVLTGFEIFNQPVSIGPDSPIHKHISIVDTIYLNHTHSVFSLEFAALNYIQPKKNHYAYKLSPFEENWQLVEDQRSATYTNLDPGIYTFQVKGSNNDQVWNNEGISITIIISPPWWNTLWFKSLLIILGIGISIALYYTRIYQLKRQKFWLQNQVESRTQELEKVNKEISIQAKDLKEKNKALASSNELITEQKRRIELQKEDINQKNQILHKTLEELKATQSHLVHSEKMVSLGQLTAGIAHEINNPINFIAVGINALEKKLTALMKVIDQYDELSSSDEVKKDLLIKIDQIKHEINYIQTKQTIAQMLKDVRVGTTRTMEIVKSLRTFSRLDEADLKIANIHDCIEATLTLLKTRLKNSIEIEKKYSPHIGEIYCYPGQLNQVFMNLIVNAADAIEDKGAIIIRTEKQNGEVIICIKDNGMGIPDNLKNKIFEPFFTTKGVGKGTGLGLSITYGIIQKHFGKIEVNSEPGLGTEFMISLPVNLDQHLN